MKILSLFDGISCGYEALLEAGIPIEKYYASEIDKYAIQVALKNHPDIIEIGDVCNVKGEDYKDVDLLIGGSPCFTKGTSIFTREGYKDVSEIEVGDMVLTVDGMYHPVRKVGGEQKPIWKISGQGFLDTFTTENHPYYVAKCKRVGHDGHRVLENPEWKKVGDIEKGDYVGIPIIEENINRKGITEQEAWLLGRYMADGHTRKDYRKGTNMRYYTVIFSIGDSKLDDFNHITEYHVGKQKHTQSTHRFVINSKRLTELCEDIGCGAMNKQIPSWILGLPKDLLIEFFKGYVSGDGYYKGNGTWRCSTVSKQLAMGLCLLSAKVFNTGAQIHFSKKSPKHIIQGRIVNQHDSYEININEYPKKQSHYMNGFGFIWFPVKQVENLGYMDTVYNIEVGDKHSYTANNITVHNCQGFSMAGKMLNFNDPRSKLFFEFVRLVKEVKPKYFLLENVKMKKEFIEVINEQLWGIQPTLIDSALVSAQNRKRLYWFGELQEDGSYKKIDIPQPEDKGITLKDILQEDVDEKYILSQKQVDMIANWGGFEDPIATIKGPDDKMGTLTTHCGKMSNGIKLIRGRPIMPYEPGHRRLQYKTYTEKCPTLTTTCASGDQKNVVLNGDVIRKLTPIECERLQTLPDNYTEGISDSKRYFALGNGWTVSVISHIFKQIKQNG